MAICQACGASQANLATGLCSKCSGWESRPPDNSDSNAPSFGKRELTFFGMLIVAGIAVVLGGRACSSSSPPSAAQAQSTQTAETSPEPAALSASTEPDPAVVFANSSRTVELAEYDLKNDVERLKKYYATREQVQSVTEVLVNLSLVKARYEDSRKPEEKALSSRADSLIPKVTQYQRMAYASSTEQIFLQNGMDVKVRANGTNKDQLQLKYVLMTQPLVYKFQNDVHLDQQAKVLGFKKIIYSDGYTQTWTVNL